MQRYNTQKAIRDAEDIISSVKAEQIHTMRHAYDDIYNSRSFAIYARYTELFLILRKISTDTIAKNLDDLITVLQNFGTVASYSDLAALVFETLQDVLITSSVVGVIDIELTISPERSEFITIDGEKVHTQNDEQIEFRRLGTTQQQQDYIFLCNYLSPPQIKVNVKYL